MQVALLTSREGGSVGSLHTSEMFQNLQQAKKSKILTNLHQAYFTEKRKSGFSDPDRPVEV